MYWGLLLYVVAALVWWFISLEQQNNQMAKLRMQQKNKGDANYSTLVTETELLRQRKHVQYVGEGITFFALIMLGAVFVYRATRRQLRLNQLQENFVMAVTHELKTPISVAKLNMETLRRRNLPANQQAELVNHTLQETERLNDLCNNILLMSSIEGGRYVLQTEPLDLSALVRHSIAQFELRFANREFRVLVEPELEVQGEKLLLEILLNNLIENAIKYSPASSPIMVRLKQRDTAVVLEVADEGPGIPAAEMRQIFKKFYRVGNEHTRKATGTGLGLYLCKKIAVQHAGSLTVRANQPNGALFELVLKR
ncbi:MAG: two-component sensor histidine kinase [Bacteroidetes bacterium]|nr:MAG: two-component sensor histidine kinase [Bacteroidota bacterium]